MTEAKNASYMVSMIVRVTIHGVENDKEALDCLEDFLLNRSDVFKRASIHDGTIFWVEKLQDEAQDSNAIGTESPKP